MASLLRHLRGPARQGSQYVPPDVASASDIQYPVNTLPPG